MPKAPRRGTGRNPNRLTEEQAAPFLEQLRGYCDQVGNDAAVAREMKVSKAAVSQLLAGKTRVGVDTAAKIAALVGKQLLLVLAGTAVPEGVRTIGEDPASMAALRAAADQDNLPPWVFSVLAKTPIPPGWPSLTPSFCSQLATIWMGWQGRMGSGVREKVTPDP